MAKAFIDDTHLGDIADSIRSKLGVQTTYLPSEMAAAINAIPSVPIQENDVTFYDYDGTVLYSYTFDEAYALTELPPLPDRTSENLSNEGWNWTLQALKEQIEYNRSIINIGCTYHTIDGNTYFYFTLNEFESSISLSLQASTANIATIDWGDGSTELITSTNITNYNHNYNYSENNKNVVVKLVMNGISYVVLRSNGFVLNGVCTTLVSSKLSNNTRLGNGAFYRTTLETINVPRYSWQTMHDNAPFSECQRLKCLVINGNILGALHSASSSTDITINITGYDTLRIASIAFYNNYSKPITVPKGATIVGDGYDYKNISKRFAIPKTTSTSLYRFGTSSMYYMLDYVVNEGVTELTAYAFYYDISLRKIVLPSTLTTIGNGALQRLYSMQKMYIKAVSPPTLTSGLTFLSANAVIYVPTGSLSAYQSATNWSSYSSQIVEYNYTLDPDNVTS